MTAEIFDRIIAILGLFIAVINLLFKIFQNKIHWEKLISFFRKFQIYSIIIVASCLIWLFFQKSITINLFSEHPYSFDPRFIIIASIFLIKFIQSRFSKINKLKEEKINEIEDLKKSSSKELELKQLEIEELKKQLTTPSQIEGSITLTCDFPPFKSIRIQRLKQTSADDKLDLTWETFSKGIEFLENRIRASSYSTPDIIFGVNETGLMMASYLSYKLSSKPFVGIIKTGGKKRDGSRPIYQFDCPRSDILQFDSTTQKYVKAEKPNMIMILDNEIKSGGSAKCIIEMIRGKYDIEIQNIIYIALGGVLKEEHKGIEINNIEYFGVDEKEYKPKIIAFYIDSPGLRGPGGMR